MNSNEEHKEHDVTYWTTRGGPLSTYTTAELLAAVALIREKAAHTISEKQTAFLNHVMERLD